MSDRLSTAPGQLATGEWTLVAEESAVTFRSTAMWVLPVRGTFAFLDGSATVVDGVPAGYVNVSTSSVSTGNTKRDRHLRSADFFDAERFPQVTFNLEAAAPSGESTSWRLDGTLTIRDQAHPVGFDATVDTTDDAVTLVADVPIDRTAWQIGPAASRIARITRLHLRATFRRSS